MNDEILAHKMYTILKHIQRLEFPYEPLLEVTTIKDEGNEFTIETNTKVIKYQCMYCEMSTHYNIDPSTIKHTIYCPVGEMNNVIKEAEEFGYKLEEDLTDPNVFPKLDNDDMT